MDTQTSIDRANSVFWNELCGTNRAKRLGVTDRSPESLRKFDDWYLSYYWYLYRHIPFKALRGKDVLEAGLGYGTVLQELVASGAHYSGLDIAEGPVEMGNHRMALLGKEPACRVGSILSPEFADGSFDCVVSIGCLHHTGNLARALREIHRILRPGGQAIFMIYYAYSFRRWHEFPKQTLQQLISEYTGRSGHSVTEEERKVYDHDSRGKVAPETVFTSRRGLRGLCKAIGFRSLHMRLELMGEGRLSRRLGRDFMLRYIAPTGGRHIYATAVK